MDIFDLTGKTAVVIGGNGTLGSEMALALASRGAAVAIVGRNEVTAKAVTQRILNVGCDARYFQADVTKKANVLELLARIRAWHEDIDVLINSAGTNNSTPFFELELNEWENVISVNATSVFLCCQVFGKYMVEKRRGGSIINISSVASDPPLSKVFTYSASKAIVNNLTKYLARELAPHQIRVNALIPGFFPAAQNSRILNSERLDAVISHTPMQRLGVPADLQGVAVWLASEAASGFVTGALIRVDGGFGAVSI